MSVEHDFLVGFSKSFGLFYLIALSAAVLVYTFWPSNKKRFDHAAQSILLRQAGIVRGNAVVLRHMPQPTAVPGR